MGITADQVTETLLDDISSRGEEIYAELQPVLEPEFDRHFVVIHVDTGDYEVAKSASAATRGIRFRHPIDGRLFLRKIGNDPEHGLAARLFASELGDSRTR